MIYSLTRGAREGMPERELLETALEALKRCRLPEEAEEEA